MGREAVGDLTDRVIRKNKNLESKKPLTISGQLGLIDQTEYFSKSVSSKNLENYTLIKNGEFAYNKSYSNGYPLGAIKRLTRYDSGVLSSLYICFLLKVKCLKTSWKHILIRHTGIEKFLELQLRVQEITDY